MSPKAGKGRTIEVKCPMCDTAGFITDKQAGRDVKCCNPECMMPVFKTPPLARQDEGPAVEKGMSPATMTVAGIAATEKPKSKVALKILGRSVKSALGLRKDGPQPPHGPAAPVNCNALVAAALR